MNHFRTFFRNHTRLFSSVDPERDWIMLSSFGALVLAGIIVWNVFAFDTVASGGVIGAPTTVSKPVFNQSSIEAIRKIFEERAAEEVKYTTGYYQYVDPSR